MKKVLVVGAGIGGLAAAAALLRQGFEVQIFEQSTVLGEVGAGLGLWSNAVRCLSELGVPEKYWEENACPILFAEVATPRGRVLSRYPVGQLGERFGAHSYVVHRSCLHKQLASLIPENCIYTRHRCHSIRQSPESVVASFTNGEEAEGDFLIGADGLHSIVRGALVGDSPPRFAGQTCFRGIAQIGVDEPNVLREVQGAGLRSAVCPLSDHHAYWWAVENAEQGILVEPNARKPHLMQRFAGWHFGLPAALEATDADSILQHDLFDRAPIRSWCQGRVALLGDAAHPTTPNLGQGACMAIQDAVVLAHFLSISPTPDDACRQYQRERLGRCHSIVKQSRRFGWIGGWSNAVAVRLRETAIAMTPRWAMDSMMRQHIGYVFQPGHSA